MYKVFAKPPATAAVQHMYAQTKRLTARQRRVELAAEEHHMLAAPHYQHPRHVPHEPGH